MSEGRIQPCPYCEKPSSSWKPQCSRRAVRWHTQMWPVHMHESESMLMFTGARTTTQLNGTITAENIEKGSEIIELQITLDSSLPISGFISKSKFDVGDVAFLLSVTWKCVLLQRFSWQWLHTLKVYCWCLFHGPITWYLYFMWNLFIANWGLMWRTLPHLMQKRRVRQHPEVNQHQRIGCTPAHKHARQVWLCYLASRDEAIPREFGILWSFGLYLSFYVCWGERASHLFHLKFKGIALTTYLHSRNLTDNSAIAWSGTQSIAQPWAPPLECCTPCKTC